MAAAAGKAQSSKSIAVNSKNLEASERSELCSSRSLRSNSICLSFNHQCFSPTLFGLIFLGGFHFLLCYLLISLPIIHGFLQLCLGYFAWEWYDLFGSRLLTRHEKVFFDEKNILETSKAFDFLLGPVLDDTTPGGTNADPCCGKYPTVELIKSLMADPKQAEMQEFYKKHYGSVYSTAVKASQDAKAAEAGATTAASPLQDTGLLKTVKSELNVSPSTSSSATSLSNESQKSAHQSKKKL